VATVAIQQGKHAAEIICADIEGRKRTQFRYRDKGQMATIGRRRAVMQRGGFRSAGMLAWALWLLVHIYFLSGFRNRLFVLIQWSWSYLTFARGTRLIVEKEWRLHASKQQQPPQLATGTRPILESGAPASASVPESVPPPPDSDEVEAATGSWASPLDGWDDPTVAYPPVRET
jgi:NADH dehydrogenase